jgi:hypothetical protein
MMGRKNIPEFGTCPNNHDLSIFRVFSHFFRLKQTDGETHIRYSMRLKRSLTQDAWYDVRTAVNNREPLFRRKQAIAIFCRVFGEAGSAPPSSFGGFGLRKSSCRSISGSADGLQLPVIMQWLKQTFAVRFNRDEDRTGHVWGDRYCSWVVEGEPPEWAVEVAAETGDLSFGTCLPTGVRSLMTENPAKNGFSPQNPARSPPPPS